MADVSIPINHAENHTKNHQNSFFTRAKEIITILVVFMAFETVIAIILISNKVIKVEDDMKQEYLIELLSQILNGILTLLSLTAAHTRIIPFITVLQLLLKSKEKNFTQSTYYIKKQNIIKKYATWHDDRYVSLLFLLLIYALWVLNLSSQFIITILMWAFSTYSKDGKVVIPMLTLSPRPMGATVIFVMCAIFSSVIVGILVGYKKYRIRKLRKLVSPIA